MCDVIAIDFQIQTYGESKIQRFGRFVNSGRRDASKTCPAKKIQRKGTKDAKECAAALREKINTETQGHGVTERAVLINSQAYQPALHSNVSQYITTVPGAGGDVSDNGEIRRELLQVLYFRCELM